MPLAPIFAQMDLYRMQPEHVFTYVAFTFGFLVVAALACRPKYKAGTTFIIWGLSAVVLSCGYGLIGIPSLMLLTPALAKIGFLLVLGGVTWSLLNSDSAAPPAKEADRV